MEAGVLERLNYFEANYDLLFNDFQQSDKTSIGTKNGACRFCGRSEPETTFRTTAHAIPEFLGNRRIILLDECDSCNQFFSKHIENHFDKYTKPIRLAGAIRGKKGVPSYKTPNKEARIDYSRDSGFEVIEIAGNELVQIDEDNRRVTINYTLEPHVPTAVFKCLVKMALSLISSDEMKMFGAEIRWILDADHSHMPLKPQIMQVTFIPGPKPNPHPAVIVLRRKTHVSHPTEVPYCVLLLTFGNYAYQISVPSFKDMQKATSTSQTLVRFPLPFECEDWEYGKLQYGNVDLASHETVSGQPSPLILSYDEMYMYNPKQESVYEGWMNPS